jgi:hypothetical protein
LGFAFTDELVELVVPIQWTTWQLPKLSITALIRTVFMTEKIEMEK